MSSTFAAAAFVPLRASRAVQPIGQICRWLARRSSAGRMLLVLLALLMSGAQAAWASGDQCSTIIPGLSGRQAAGPVALDQGDVITIVISAVPQAVNIETSGYSPLESYTTTGTFSYTVPSTAVYVISIENEGGTTLSCGPLQTTFTVTTAADDSNGLASNCATGSTAACTLRDALAAAAASTSTGLMVNFSPTLAGTSGTTPFTITLTETGGRLNVPSNTTVQGLTTGSGASLQNLVTVTGPSQDNNSIFAVASGVASAAINNLNITNGFNGISVNGGTLTVNQCNIHGNISTGQGGGIFNTGTLTLTNSAVTGNTSDQGGGISNAGTLTVSNSTIANNVATTYWGGGIYIAPDSGVKTTLQSVTITGNSAPLFLGGGIYNPGTQSLVLGNTIIEANSAAGDADLSGSYSDNGGNVLNNRSAGTSNLTAAQLGLAPLGNYGGPTQTMPVLPTSPAFCAASSSTNSTDQRGFAIPTTYGAQICADTGATNSGFGLGWTTEPASTYYEGAALSPAPVVQFEDHTFPLPYGANVTLSDTSHSINTIVGLGSSGSYSVTTPITALETSDTILAVDQEKPYMYLSAASTPFAVVSPVAGFLISTLPSTEVAGTPESFTVTALSSLSPATTATGFTGTVTFSSGDTNAVLPASYTFVSGDNGVHTFTNGLTFKTTGSQTVTVSSGTVTTTTPSITVTAASPATITASSGTGQSAMIGAAFAIPLTVQVLDAFNNPAAGVAVTFTSPTTGASATLSAANCTTSTAAPAGTCSVTATANGTASATAYTVSAKAAGIIAGASFTLTNTQYTATMTVAQTPATAVYGQQATVVASISPLSISGSAPTGAVTIYDGATSIGAGSAISGAGVSSFTTATAPSVGTHNYAASYAGNTNFTSVAKTAAPGSVVVSKASSTLTGPTSTVLIPYGQSGTFKVSLAGQYSGAGITPPSGNVSASVGDGLNTSLAGSTVNGVATFTFPSNGYVHTYNVTVNYGGDSNYAAATTIIVPVQVGQITPTIAFAQPSAITYGAPLGGILNATAANSGSAVAGAFTYTATPAGGSASAVTSASVLEAGSYAITATFAPTDSTTYKGTSASVTLVVNKATPTIVWAKPASITYGTLLGATQLDATATGVGGAALPGTFTYSPAAGTLLTPMGAGVIQSLGVVFTPTDTVDYTTAMDAVGITVNPATPAITWAAPAAITYGTPLSSAQLNATASAPGTLVYTPAVGTVLGAGSQMLKVSLTPTDATDYTATTRSVTLMVNQEPLSVVVANVSKAYGAALPTLAGTVTGVVNGDAISAAYSTTATATSAVGMYPITAAISGAALANYAVTNTPGMLTITKATLTATASNATRVYGAANPTFTGTVAGQQNGDKFTETFSTTATSSSTVGTYAIVPSVAGTNLADYTVAATNGTLSVTQATPSIALITSAASVLDQNPVTFTATVGSTVSAPTGTVAFLDGTTMLGSGTLAGGAASFTTTSLAVGTHTITAVYSGDTNFAGATSAAVSQAVQDFNLNISTSAGSTTSVTVVPGGTATYTLIISPTGSTTFPAAVALSVSGLPTGATYTLTPSSIAAGAGTTNVTLTIQVPKTTAMLHQSQPFGKGLAPIALGLLLLPFSRRMRRSARKLGRTASLLLLLLVGVGAMAAVTGCGASTGYFGQPQQSYTVSVTGTSGALVHSTTVTLTVQ